MQFQVQTKGQEGRHAVSSASRGSREENVRGVKLRKGREGRHAESRPMQFQVQAGAPGKKTSGAPNWRRKGREGRHAEPMQFQMQAGAPEKKTSGAPNWRRKGQEGRHAVSSASRGSREENIRAPNWRKKVREMRHAISSASMDSREENFRGAKLTEKRTRGVPCSFKYKQVLQGRKRQGRQIDGEKEKKSLNCQTYFPFGLKIRNVVFLNSIIMMLVSFTYLLYFTTPRQCHPWSYKGKSSWYSLVKWKKK